MNISYSCNPGGLNTHIGYGNAGYQFVTALQRYGHNVLFQDSSCPVEIAFCHPDMGEWSNDDAHHIQYTPWESTVLPDGWVEAFNENADEVWTTSTWVREVFLDHGVKGPISVVPHGIDHAYTPRHRKRDGVLKFLSLGAPEPRKNAQMSIDAFTEAFGTRTDVSLTVKGHERLGRLKALPGINVNAIIEDLSRDEMIKLVHNHDVLLYPTSGEGFGFIPLEGMATGMPVISTADWADYAHLLLEDLTLKAELGPSVHPEKYPGQMYHPDFYDYVQTLLLVEDKFETYADVALSLATTVHREFDWDSVVRPVSDYLTNRFGRCPDL